MTTSNATAADHATEKTVAEKVHEKLAEKRRALGRGLESLLPGPRAVVAAPTLPIPGILNALQAVASGQASDGEHVFELALDRIDENPYQTRQEFDPKALTDLAGSIQTQGVLQPIVVRPAAARPIAVESGLSLSGGEQLFILILGERRFRASMIAG
jgi:ParB family chromosome partitioning protein